MAYELAEGGYDNPSAEFIVKEIQRYAEVVEGYGPCMAGVAPLARITPIPASYIESGTSAIRYEPLTEIELDEIFRANKALYDALLGGPELAITVGRPELDVTFKRVRQEGDARETVRHARFSGRLAITVVQRTTPKGTGIDFWPQINLGDRSDQILANYGVAVPSRPRH